MRKGNLPVCKKEAHMKTLEEDNLKIGASEKSNFPASRTGRLEISIVYTILSWKT